METGLLQFALLADGAGHLVWTLPLFVLAVALLAGAALVFHLVLGAPAARVERARFFLHLLECGARLGKSPGQTVAELAQTRTLDLGARFHLVAAHLASGLTLSRALDRVPRFLPPPIRAMLAVGEELGDPAKVLPACRALLGRGAGNRHAALLMPLVLLSVLLPLAIAATAVFHWTIAPRVNAVFSGLVEWHAGGASGAQDLWTDTRRWLPVFLGVLAGLWVFCAGAAFLVLAGPRVREWTGGERLLWLFPWVRRRCRRDFAAMLAVLLDAGVPERRALALAVETTGQRQFIAKVARASAQLEKGAGLAQVVEQIEGRGEFAWRLTNALRAGGRFLDAIQGWLVSLELKAERSEQAAAQAIFVATVLLQGLLVGALTIAVFGLLAGIIHSFP